MGLYFGERERKGVLRFSKDSGICDYQGEGVGIAEKWEVTLCQR